jgi:Xaa-Pro aminopeptidase
MAHEQYIRQLKSQSHGVEAGFSRGEFASRVERVRRRMAEARLDALLVTFPPDLYYLAGYNVFGLYNHCTLVLPLVGDPVLQVKVTEVPGAVTKTWVDEITSWELENEEVPGYAGQIASLVAGALKARGLEKGRTGVQLRRPGIVPSVYGAVRDALPDATLIDASDLVMKVRMVKSDAEMDCLRRSGQITVAGMKASLAAVRAGVTDNEIAAAGTAEMVRSGSEFFSVQPIVTTGVRSAWGHQTYRRTTVQPGDAVFIEFGASYLRYTAPLMRTAVAGRPTRAMADRALAVREVLDATLGAIRPGITCGDVARATLAAAARLPTTLRPEAAQTFGYSLGCSFPPTWGEYTTYLQAGNLTPLVPNMAFHVHYGLRAPGEYGVTLSEAVAVTAGGIEVLSPGVERGLFEAQD